MDALRCRDCGDTRWSLSGFTRHTGRRCELCGGEMVPERRAPNHGPSTLRTERRDVHLTRMVPGRRSDRPPVASVTCTAGRPAGERAAPATIRA